MTPSRTGLPLEQLCEVLQQRVSVEQGEVVTAPLEAGVVVAGAGSGKTATMVARVAWLVGSGLVAPDQVLGLTFTSKAADELAGRVRVALRRLRAAGLLDPAQADLEPVVSTYHAYAGRLVRDHALRLGREPGARLVTPATSWQLAARAVATYDGPMDAVGWAESTVVQAVLQLAGDLAEHLVEAADVHGVTARLDALAAGAEKLLADGRKVQACQASRVQLLPVVERYAAAKRARDLLDFGDVVALAARLARDCPEVREVERATSRVVLLDEYQDTGAAQEVLLSALFGDDHPVTAVGDPCQSVYGWRGASAGTLRRFPSRFGASRATPRTLRTTYRNGGRVLLLANAVSAPLRAVGLPVPQLEPAPGREDDGHVRCALLDDVPAEAAWVADQVVAARAALPAPGAGEPDWARAAVLCRKRSMFPRLREAFEARDVPVEVVGLGGLLDVPEVADLVATLRVLDDPTADADLLRLLTGARWRIGPRDLAELGRRARALVRGSGPGPDDPVQKVVLGVDETSVGSLVDALDDLPPAGDRDPFSPEGRRRLEGMRSELRALRRRLDQPLPDLVADVERTLGLDVEVAARPGAGEPSAARADLDAFADAAASFAGDAAQDGAGESVLSAFLAYLAAAEEEENGLDTGTTSGADTVKLMTVHAAKGLEWPVVAVPGLARSTSGGSAVFPAKPATSTSWTGNARLLPFPLRGDRDDLPGLDGLDPVSLRRHVEANEERDAREERRLAYVAVTRAERLLLCSGHHWGDGKKPLGPSVFLQEAREACLQGAGDVDVWVDEPPLENPVTTGSRSAPWPSTDLPADPRVQAAAARVRALLAEGLGPDALLAGGAFRHALPAEGEGPDLVPLDPLPLDTLPLDTLPLDPVAAAVVAAWDDDLRRLAEEAQRRRGARSQVLLPSSLSVSGLVELRRDPEGLARTLLRPVPRKPSPVARRGTAFHLWLEQSVFGMPALLDDAELPGSADEDGADPDLAALQDAFRSSAWWGRAPREVEVPFEADVEGVLVRGRMDAVFAEPGGRFEVVDWKTGRVPTGRDADAAAVQLAVYRLAWSALAGVPLEQVSAAFHHVREGRTVRPVDLLDAEGLAALVRGVPLVEQPG
ncbi:MAG: UvrD/REP helicase [Frankiales bacterium]|nr:UvrD/REP helicase [Frankiales bacterium]